MAHDAYTKGLHTLAEGVYAYLEPPGLWGENNCGLIIDKGHSMVVDTKYDLVCTTEMITAMKTLDGAFPADYLVNTHADGDHIFGNELFKEAEIIASKSCAEAFATELSPQDYAMLLENAPGMGKLGQYFLQAFGRYDFENISLTPPTKTFEGRLEMRVGEKEVLLIQVGPAHTRGDVMVFLPGDKVLFTGDLIMTAAGPVSWEGPLENLLKAMDLILDLDVEVLVPGHGPIAGKTAAQETRDYWAYTGETARQYFDQGLSATEAATALSSKGMYNSEPYSILNMINTHMLYHDFSSDDAPLDKAVIMGRIADIMIPDQGPGA
jgi:glyoxylase-like metal-dependent hydrolase (beta-lactamase superfamily II)